MRLSVTGADGKTREVGDAIEALLSDWKGTP